MCMTQTKNIKYEAGFALLMTLLVLGVVIAVTLGLVELTLKTLQLSVDSTDSEIAFHAANAGIECAKYSRRIESTNFETGGTVPFSCFGSSGNLTKVAHGFVTVPSPLVAANGQVNRYTRNIDWGTAPNARCTSMDIITIVATTSVTIGGTGNNSLKLKISGYENDTKTCVAGGRCTIISVAGYSGVCSATSTEGVLKREILLEF